MHTTLPRMYRAIALFATGIALSFQSQVGIAQDNAPTNQVNITSKDTNRMGWESLDIPQTAVADLSARLAR